MTRLTEQYNLRLQSPVEGTLVVALVDKVMQPCTGEYVDMFNSPGSYCCA